MPLTDDERALLADLQARAGEDEPTVDEPVVVVIEPPTVDQIEAAGEADAARIEAQGRADAARIEAEAEADVERIEAHAEATEQVIEAQAEAAPADELDAGPGDAGDPPDPSPRSRHWLYRQIGRK